MLEQSRLRYDRSGANMEAACTQLFASLSTNSRHEFRQCVRSALLDHPVGGPEEVICTLRRAFLEHVISSRESLMSISTYMRHVLPLAAEFPVLSRTLWELAVEVVDRCTDAIGRCFTIDAEGWLASAALGLTSRASLNAVIRILTPLCIPSSASGTSPWRHALLLSLLSHTDSSGRSSIVFAILQAQHRGGSRVASIHDTNVIPQAIASLTCALLACADVDGAELIALAPAITQDQCDQPPAEGAGSTAGGCAGAPCPCSYLIDAVGQALLLGEDTVDSLPQCGEAYHTGEGQWREWCPCDCSASGCASSISAPLSSISGCLRPLYARLARPVDPLIPLRMPQSKGRGKGRAVSTAKVAQGTKEGDAARDTPIGTLSSAKMKKRPNPTSLALWGDLPADVLTLCLGFLGTPRAITAAGSTCTAWRDTSRAPVLWHPLFARLWTVFPHCSTASVGAELKPLKPGQVRCVCNVARQGASFGGNGTAHDWFRMFLARARAESVAEVRTRQIALAKLQVKQGRGRGGVGLRALQSGAVDKLARRWKDSRGTAAGLTVRLLPVADRMHSWVPAVCDVCVCSALLPSLKAAAQHMKTHHGLEKDKPAVGGVKT